jgi:hypothetical protein
MSNDPNAGKVNHNTGTANATAISFFAGCHEFASSVYVTLLSNYARAVPAGYPDPVPGADPKTSKTATPQTIPSGTRVLLMSAEAAAIVAAGAGVFDGASAASVWSASDAAANAMTLTNGGLTVTPSANAGYQSVRGTISQTSGKLYVEFKANANEGNVQMGWGIASASFVPTSYLGSSASSAGSYNQNAGNFVTAGFTSVIALGLQPSAANDVWAIAIDLTAGKYWVAQNNVWAGGGNPAAGTSPMVTIAAPAFGLAYFPALSLESANHAWTLQPTAASQKYAPPAGFTPWG